MTQHSQHKRRYFMQRTLVSIIIVCLVSGVVGAFAYDQLGSNAGAVPPPPSPTQVREQNLDTSGFIRVHEQGTANVTGTVNVGNLPTVQDVNVISMPAAPQARLIELGTQTVTIGSGAFQSSFIDIRDCGTVTVMARATSADTAQVEFFASPDGINPVGVSTRGVNATRGISGVATASLRDEPATYPFMLVFVSANGTSGQQSEITAWIWCEP